MKTTFKRFTEFTLKPQEQAAILTFLEGKISSRKLGTLLGCSHQQAINLTSSICRDWYQKGLLTLKQGR